MSSLSTFQKGAQRAAFAAAAEGVLRERFGAGDASGLLALVLHDAATYDAATKAGGFDGSILTNRWAARGGQPETAPLQPLLCRSRCCVAPAHRTSAPHLCTAPLHRPAAQRGAWPARECGSEAARVAPG